MKIHQKSPMTGRKLAMLDSSDLLRIRGGAYEMNGNGSSGLYQPIPVKTPDTHGR